VKQLLVCAAAFALLSTLVVQAALPEDEAAPAPRIYSPASQAAPVVLPEDGPGEPPVDSDTVPPVEAPVGPDDPKKPRDYDTLLTRKEVAKLGNGLRQLAKTDWGYSLWVRIAAGRITEVRVKDKAGRAQRLLREVIVHPPGASMVPLRLTGKRPALWVTRYPSRGVSSFKFLDTLAHEYVRVSVLDNPSALECSPEEWVREVELVWSFRDPVSDNGLVLRHILPREQTVRIGTGLPGQGVKHSGKKTPR
jgi:hypothetical protein